MLEELTVANYALIEKARVEFGPGLNVLTGETGAGKSILIGALGLLLGSKAEGEIIRTGAEEASVAGVFAVPADSEREEWAVNAGLALDAEPVIVRRVVRHNKRSTCHIQDSPVSRAQLEEFAGFLVDLHGQHEHQSLFSTEAHRRNLDRYSGLSPDLEQFQKGFQALTQLKKDYQALLSDESARSEEQFKLRQTVEEISAADIKPGEEEELKAEKRRLDQFEKLFSALENIQEALEAHRGSALGNLKVGLQAAQSAAAVDSSLEPLTRRLDSAAIEVEDIADSFRSYQHSLNFSPERQDQVNARLTQLHALQKKYAPTEEGLLACLAEALKKLDLLENLGSRKEALVASLMAQEKLVLAQAGQLSQKRAQGALKLEKQIEAALAELGMGRAELKISLTQKLAENGKPVCGPWGLDVVEFLFSANPGEPVKPLKEIASGGELSRVMLALKSILSDSDNIPILVFDEIDTGIGGEIGNALGRFMKKIARSKQVLCITHLASIASFADRHLKIEKLVDGNRTTTQISPVTGEHRVREIARMLSGESAAETGLEHARSMLAKNAGSV